MNKLTLFIALVSINLNAFSQDTNEVKRDMLVRALYSNDSIRYNNTKHNVFKFEEYKETDFFNVVITQKEIFDCTELVTSTSEIHINEENQLVFTGKLTDRFNKQSNDILSIDLIENKLLKANGEQLELKNFYDVNCGYGKISFKTSIKSNYTLNEKISGFLEFELNYLIGYDKIELTLKDIGKTITLNKCQYKIINIKGNEIVLDKICEYENELKVINFNNKGEVAKPYSYMEVMKMVKNDSTIAMESFNTNNRKTYKMVYDLFEKRPTITFKEFKEIFTSQKLIEMKEYGQYIIVKNIAPFENKIILYSPLFQSEIIKVVMK